MKAIKRFKDDWMIATTREKAKWIILGPIISFVCVGFVIYEMMLFTNNHNFLHVWLSISTIPLLLILCRIPIKSKGK